MIDKYKFRCYKVLPVVYDEALSYYEVLCGIAKKLNECIEIINQDIPDYSELEEAVENLQTDVGTINEGLTQIDERLDAIEGQLSLKGKTLVNETITSGSVDVAIQNVDIMDCTLLKVHTTETGCPNIICSVTYEEGNTNGTIDGIAYDYARNNTRFVITLQFNPTTNKITYNRSYKTTDGTTMTSISIDKIEALM